MLNRPKKKEEHTLTINNLKVYGAEGATVDINSQINALMKQHVAIRSITRNKLCFNLTNKGEFSIDIMTVNGRVVKSFDNKEFKAGMNSLDLNNLSGGVYLISIHNKIFKTSVKTIIL